MGCNCGNKNNTVVSGVPTTVTTDLCSCGKPKHECGKGSCGCNHEQKPCLADHTKTLVESVYTTTVTATDTWVMPAVDDCVQLHLKDVTNILPGAILWNKSVGSLHVSSYDATTGYVTACNEGEEGNAEAGSDFPSCMSFHIGIPTECDCDSGYTGACLAADVTSPGVGETTEVSVTTVSGLFIGDIIDIAGFMYKIVAINDVNTIVVKNEGFGAPIGTVIKNDPNCTGKPCTVKITVVNSDDPCTKDPVNEGVLIVCDEGERKPFEGTADDQIAVWDNEDKKWKLETVKLKEECTNTTVDVTLDPLISVYVVTVEKTSIFKVGEVVYLADRKFTVDSIINSTQMRITIDEAPSAITVVEEGAALCLGDCCENFDIPDKYSDVILGLESSLTPINNYYEETDGQLENLVSTKNDGSEVITTVKSKTISIAAPTSGPVSLIGQIVVNYKGVAYSDSHYNNDVDNYNFTVPARVVFASNVTVTNGATVTKLFPDRQLHFYSSGLRGSGPDGVVSYPTQTINGLYSYKAFYSTPLNQDGIADAGSYSWDTKMGACPAEQTLVLPISLVVDGSKSISLKIDTTFMLLNARGLLVNPRVPTDEEIKVLLKEYSIATSLAWVIQ